MNPGATPRPTTLLPLLTNWPNPFWNLVPNFVPYPKVPCHLLLPGGEFQLLPLATEDLEDDDKGSFQKKKQKRRNTWKIPYLRVFF